LISLSVLVGCEVNAQLEGVRDPADEPAASAPEDADIAALRNAGFSSSQIMKSQIMKTKDPVAGE
jgi:hypothetical protein